MRAEGCVAVVLQATERAADAGNRARALLAASGTNADGRTVGLSLPSADSQAGLLRHVYDAAGIDPEATRCSVASSRTVVSWPAANRLARPVSLRLPTSSRTPRSPVISQPSPVNSSP